MDETITIVVNGAARELRRGTTVAGLIEALELDPTRVAVERNHDVVPRKDHGRVILAAGDHVEVVGFVGGG
jgi:thiamine biosynthesis protein ThiS